MVKSLGVGIIKRCQAEGRSCGEWLKKRAAFPSSPAENDETPGVSKRGKA